MMTLISLTTFGKLKFTVTLKSQAKICHNPINKHLKNKNKILFVTWKNTAKIITCLADGYLKHFYMLSCWFR